MDDCRRLPLRSRSTKLVNPPMADGMLPVYVLSASDRTDSDVNSNTDDGRGPVMLGLPFSCRTLPNQVANTRTSLLNASLRLGVNDVKLQSAADSESDGARGGGVEVFPPGQDATCQFRCDVPKLRERGDGRGDVAQQ